MKRAALVLLAACGAQPAPARPLPTHAPEAKPVTTISEDALAREFLDELSKHDFARAFARFDDKMRAAMPEAKLGETWSAIEAQAGALERLDAIEVRPAGDFRVAVAKASFARAPLVLRVVLDGAGRVAGFFVAPGDAAGAWTPPDYVKPDAFAETEVAVAGLPGTLTMPKNAPGRLPAVVLVHGSGPNDRDESIGPNKPFKDLAWGLASRGVVVLRYDKRTRVDPRGVRTQRDEVEDAAHAAVALLRARAEVDPARVALLGHSQGGYLAPRIAESDRGIAKLVILAGSTRPLEDSLVAQLDYFATLRPDDAKAKAAAAEARRFKAAVESASLKADDEVATPFGSSIPGAYFLDVRGYEPARVAARLRVPLLVLQGERDYQVTADDFAGWRAALAHDPRATLRTFPGLNHLFMTGDDPPSPADYEKPGHVDARVIDAIASFVSHP